MTDNEKDIDPPALGHDAQFYLGPRPGKKSIEWLKSLQLTHCCTLLSEREDVQPIRKICQKIECEWVWLPMEGGRLEILSQTDLAAHVTTLHESVARHQSPRIYFHCSAGIHRTGFFVYLLLRLRGLNRDEAVAELTRLRPVTADQVGDERLDLADKVVTTLAHTISCRGADKNVVT